MATHNSIVQAITVLFEDETDGITKVVFPATDDLLIKNTDHGARLEVGISFTPVPNEETGITHFILKMNELSPSTLPDFTVVQTPDAEMYIRIPVKEEDELCWQGLNHMNRWHTENWLDHEELEAQSFTIISMPIKAKEVMHA